MSIPCWKWWWAWRRDTLLAYFAVYNIEEYFNKFLSTLEAFTDDRPYETHFEHACLCSKYLDTKILHNYASMSSTCKAAMKGESPAPRAWWMEVGRTSSIFALLTSGLNRSWTTHQTWITSPISEEINLVKVDELRIRLIRQMSFSNASMKALQGCYTSYKWLWTCASPLWVSAQSVLLPTSKLWILVGSLSGRHENRRVK